jgi:prophage antirepressor-like protein
LGYKQPAIAITKHVRERHAKTLREILEKGVYDSHTPSNPNKTDLASRWITEPGLYQLVFKSHLACAEQFQDFVFENVLPSIRKTGSYSIQSAAPAAEQTDAWLDKRLEGKELMKVKNASLQQLIAGGFGQTGSKLYRIVANHINQAVLGFTQTTTQFKKQHQLPRHVSIPDILNMQGQVARCYAETCLQKFVSDNLQRLRGLAEADLIKEFTQLKLNLRQGFVSTGMGDLQTKMLTLTEVKKRKADIESHSRKQQRLLQAEQPKLIESAA